MRSRRRRRVDASSILFRRQLSLAGRGIERSEDIRALADGEAQRKAQVSLQPGAASFGGFPSLSSGLALKGDSLSRGTRGRNQAGA